MFSSFLSMKLRRTPLSKKEFNFEIESSLTFIQLSFFVLLALLFFFCVNWRILTIYSYLLAVFLKAL